MWTRAELKDKAKVSFKANYWRAVLVALILLALIGGVGGLSPSFRVPIASPTAVTSAPRSADNVNVEIEDGKVKVDVDDGRVHVNVDPDELEDFKDLEDVFDDLDDETVIEATNVFWPGVILVGLCALLIALAAAALAIALYVLIFSPLEVGAQRFFVRNLNQPAEVKEVAFAYDNNYKETVKTMFLRLLFIFLWGLLFIIPGIYKSYEYRMIPYLLAEDPTMTKDRAFAESKRMMDGQKWNAFVLDLSFLGWNILSALTLGILGVFYVGPYQAQTNAALYEKLRYGRPAPEQAAQPAPYAPTDAAGAQMAAPVVVATSQPPVPPFAQVGAQPAPAPEVAAPATPAPETTAPMPESTPADTASMAPAPEVTAPIPETGIDPTEQMPEVEENNTEPDSPEA